MPRANRSILPGYVYHLTHRCHDRKFLLKFAQDRDRYRATMVDSGAYLWECLKYVELNMVRCGVVCHPREWSWSDQNPESTGEKGAFFPCVAGPFGSRLFLINPLTVV
jgi:REP element-mobilizing transposase RayT